MGLRFRRLTGTFSLRTIMAKYGAIRPRDTADTKGRCSASFAFPAREHKFVDVDHLRGTTRTVSSKACSAHVAITRRSHFDIYEVVNRTMLAAHIAEIWWSIVFHDETTAFGQRKAWPSPHLPT